MSKTHFSILVIFANIAFVVILLKDKNIRGGSSFDAFGRNFSGNGSSITTAAKDFNSTLRHFVFAQVPKTGTTSFSFMFRNMSLVNGWDWDTKPNYRQARDPKMQAGAVK